MSIIRNAKEVITKRGIKRLKCVNCGATNSLNSSKCYNCGGSLTPSYYSDEDDSSIFIYYIYALIFTWLIVPQTDDTFSKIINFIVVAIYYLIVGAIIVSIITPFIKKIFPSKIADIISGNKWINIQNIISPIIAYLLYKIVVSLF